MTRTEKRFIERTVRMTALKLAGAPADVIQSLMLSEIEKAIEWAAEEDAGNIGADVGAAEPGKLPQPPVLQRVVPDYGGMPDADPQTVPRTALVPVEQPQPKSLLILPGQEGFSSARAGKPKVGIDEPLAVWREPKKDLTRGAYQKRWQRAISELVELINRHMPPIVQVTPTGTKINLNIERINVLSDVVSGMVKATYGIPGQAGSSRSNRNVGGQILDPMCIDRLVTQTFDIHDRSVNWEQRIADLKIDAAEVFKPRPAELQNHTPARPGPVELLMSGDPRRNAGGYGEVGGDPNSIDPTSEAGGVLVLDTSGSQVPARRARGPIVPGL